MWLAASSFEVPDGLLAIRAAAQLNPKPHQGLSSKNPAPHPTLDDANSTVALGLRASLALNGVRQSERARYYGSALGRFTSPDEPLEDQHPEDPQSWNLYSYVRNNPLKNTDPTGRDCTDGVSACLNYIAGGLKALGNVPTDIVNAPDHIANAIIAPFTDYRFPDALPTPFAPANEDQREGFEAAKGVMLVTPAAEVGVAKVAEVTEATTQVEAVSETGATTSEVPTSIPAGPTARPTVAQQKAINEMGDAHGCSTCGATTPGTKSGNWVGDHQPPTALNTSGGPQVYKPQCLQCSRQQGGQVAAAARAAKKACSSGTQNCQ